MLRTRSFVFFCALPVAVASGIGCPVRPAGQGEGEGEGVEGEGEGEGDLAAACAAVDLAAGLTRPPGWSARSHCKQAPADVDVVFAAGVQRLDIVMGAAEYAAMQDDLDDLTGGGGGGGGDDAFVDACVGLNVDDACSVDFGGGPEVGVCVDVGVIGCFPDSFRPPEEWIAVCAEQSPGAPCTTSDGEGRCQSDGVSFACFPDGPGPNPGAGPDPCANLDDGAACLQGTLSGLCTRVAADLPLFCEADGFDEASVDDVPIDAAAAFWDRKPRYFHADVDFAGAHFTDVGIRFKGNNGLATAEGEKKPIRIKMDEWEDEIPAITDQRLFGFQHLSLSPNQTDPSQLHQVMAAAVFRRHGVPAPHSTWIEVTLDSGDGPRLLGVYAMTEIPDGPLLKRNFENSKGALYKPDGRGAHFVGFIAASCHAEDDVDAACVEVESFVAALHADASDRTQWRSGLRAVFDIDAFIDFYAINQAIGNWDTYGGFAHNFYLYADPDTAQLRFLPWDFDLSFDGTGPTDLSLRGFDGRWPLLQAVARDAEFATRYHQKLRAFADAEFADGTLEAEVDDAAAALRAAVEREDAERGGTLDAFDDGVAQMKFHLGVQRGALRQQLDALGL